MERFFILDGMAIAYRAYFAFINRPLINSKGINTSAIFGFVSTLEKILTTEKPDHIAVAFDTKEPTFRHRNFSEYKATREKMPDDMVEQLPYLKRIVEAYNIPCLELPGWEADDIIGTLARRSEREDLECFMVTPDKDYMQLVTERVKLFRPGKSGDSYDVIGIEGVAEKFGVRPDQVIDVLGLMGDQSDNIPGVKGIGEKTAIPLVQEFGSIPGIYNNLEQISKRTVRAKLEEQREMAFLSRELVTIDIDAPIEVDPHDLKIEPKNIPVLRELFTELEMTRFLQKLDDSDEIDDNTGEASGLRNLANTPHTYVTVKTQEQLDAMIADIMQMDEFCFDTETTGTNALLAKIVGMSFSINPSHGWYVPANDALPVQDILATIQPLFTSGKKLIGQNLKYDLTILKQLGIETAQPLYDTMIAAYILRPEGDHDMDSLSMQMLGYQPVSITTLIGKGKEQLSMADIEIDGIAEYAAEDADITLQLAHVLRSEIERTRQERLLDEIEFPLIHVLVDMESAGIKIDSNALADISKEMESQIGAATMRIYDAASEKFNIGSTKQLGFILFEKLGLPTGKKTKTGYSTDVSVLESLQGRHPIIDEILLYRQLTKLKSTYVDSLPKMVNPNTGRIHTSYNQAVAATGRLSSTDPNLQNIPIRTEAGREIRRAFIAEGEDYVILSADYSQIELRLAAEISGDEGMLHAFASGEDIHASTAMRLFGVSGGEVTSDMRRQAKTTNFGILYGISAFGLAQRLGISNPDAKDLIDLYFSRYPKINRYIAQTIGFAKTNGYVETIMGRRRYLPDIHNKNRNVRMFAERVAINAPIQGSAADMIKIAMIDIHCEMKKRGLKSRMLLQVHDELVFEVHKDEMAELKPLVEKLMKSAMNVRVPIEVETGVGVNWLDAH